MTEEQITKVLYEVGNAFMEGARAMNERQLELLMQILHEQLADFVTEEAGELDRGRDRGGTAGQPAAD